MPKRRGYAHKRKVLSLVDRESGEARSMVIDNLKAETIVPILKENIAKEARVMTDDAGQYKYLNEHFSEHGCVRHSTGEYVSLADPSIHTNTVEGFFSIFKRGMKGVYQHCKKHIFTVIWRSLISAIASASPRALMIPNGPKSSLKVL